MNIQISKNTVYQEVCSVSVAKRVAAMLDLNPNDLHEGAPLPRGWHFMLMAADTRKSQLRKDGFPGLGVSMPDLGFPRLMLGGRSVSYLRDIPIGASVNRFSAMQSLIHKETKAGPMAVATIEHELRLAEETLPALVETQTYLLLPASKEGFKAAAKSKAEYSSENIKGSHVKTVVPDETMLFQYSALGFNSHKIHIDKNHAQQVEGFPDLVVNGGLVNLLMTEFLRNEIGVSPTSTKTRHLAPLFSGNPITMIANKSGLKWQLQTYDNQSNLAVDMEVEAHEF
jgi:3-methylfumaryl-CoA hydratase